MIVAEVDVLVLQVTSWHFGHPLVFENQLPLVGPKAASVVLLVWGKSQAGAIAASSINGYGSNCKSNRLIYVYKYLLFDNLAEETCLFIVGENENCFPPNKTFRFHGEENAYNALYE